MNLQLEPTAEQLNESLKNFAVSMADAIGTTETFIMLNNLADFAKTCPDALRELKILVEGNPEMVQRLLTPAGVIEAKALINMVAEWAPAFSAFGQ